MRPRRLSIQVVNDGGGPAGVTLFHFRPCDQRREFYAMPLNGSTGLSASVGAAHFRGPSPDLLAQSPTETLKNCWVQGITPPSTNSSSAAYFLSPDMLYPGCHRRDAL